MAKNKKRKAPKKGLTLRPGQCRVIKTRVRVCVSRSGKITVTPTKSRKRTVKKGAAKRKPTRRKTAKRRTTKRKKQCVTGAFKQRTKKGIRCACGVRGKKRGSLRLQVLSMKHPKCRAGIPGPMTWRAYKEKRSGVAKRRIISV